MNSKKKNIQKTSGTHKKYQPGQLITVGNCVFRIVKNTSNYTDCRMCDLDQWGKWCMYCINDGYFKLVKN